MKTARKWTVPGINSYGGGSDITDLDQNGWPNTDAELVVWHGIKNMNGTYYLEGESNAMPTISAGYGNAEIQNFKYRGGRFSANLIYHSTDGSGLMLRFMDTAGGIRNVRLMRPRTVGSSIPYSTNVTFTDQAKKLVANFKVIRFLWSIDCWNGPWQTNWDDRIKPAYCSYNRGTDEVYSSPSGQASITWAGKGMSSEGIDLNNTSIYIIGPLTLQNEFLAYVINKEIGSKCSIFDRELHSFSPEQTSNIDDSKENKLILIDTEDQSFEEILKNTIINGTFSHGLARDF